MLVSEYSSSDQIDLERGMQRSCSPVPQRRQCKPTRGNRRFDRSPGGSDSSESGYNGSRNTRGRTNGELEIEKGWSPKRRKPIHRVGTNNVTLQENSNNLNEQRVQELIRNVMDSKATREDKRYKLAVKGPEESPIIDEIRDYISPSSFKQPSVPTYDDVDGCPNEHLMKYKSFMALFNNNDTLMCIVFQATLSGEALTWFNKLRPRSIHIFPQLANKFSKHYRYNRKTIKDDVAQAFKNALSFDKSRLYNSLTLKAPETVQDLLVRADSVSLSELNDKLKGKLSKSFPMKPDTEGKRDKSKKCKYHNDFGHTLNDCYAFKKEISRMADGGQLKEYLKGSQKLAHVNLVEHDVIVVCHAQAAACSSNRERKWSMKRKIQKIGNWNHVNSVNFKSGFNAKTIVEGGLTFIEEDERGVYYPHNDVVVITTWVGIRIVQRILIDTGSSAFYVVNTRRRKREQVDRASSESIDPVDVEDRQTLASLRKQLKRNHRTVND
ncbi:hypothetical protein IFM89_032563 [Coptis chinensis]|uniref:Retrotransposon gag domain-containing protein n=1 Tax=Coptis chinensis TaxID=261450 RepID=A0A835I889_9MAGN|nr:hypothetical protein IFM89_032563 [Coptis chinensis]